MPLKGNRALITGAGKRLGQAMAIGLAKSRCDVAIHYSESEQGARETLDQVRAFGRKAEIFQADFRRREAPGELAQAVVSFFGGLDVLVNSASNYPNPELVQGTRTILTESVETWEESLVVNARAPFFLIQACAPALLESGRGCIVNILDESASDPWPGRAAHSVSKGALRTITELAHRTFHPKIRVTALELGSILPGETMSDSESKKTSWGSSNEVVENLLWVIEDETVAGEIIGVGSKDDETRNSF